MKFETLIPESKNNDELELNKKVNRFSDTVKNNYENELEKNGEEDDGQKGQEEYKINENKVLLKWKNYLPENTDKKVFDKDRAVIFLPGFNNTEDASKVASFSHELADYSDNQVYAITTRAEKIEPDILNVESQAIYKMMIEKGLKEITLVGHSTGGGKALILASIMSQINQEINLEGLILVDSVSLYEQSNSGFALNFAKDAKITNKEINNISDVEERERIKKMSEAYVNEGRLETAKEAKRSGINMPKRLLSQINDAASISPSLDSINVPVVLVQGGHDILSQTEKIIPKKDGDGHIENYKEREDYLRENVFTKSPYVRMVLADKLGNHNLPYFRPESVAKTGLYLLERWNRDKNN